MTRVLAAAGVVVVLLVAGWSLQQEQRSAGASSWTNWSCSWNVVNYSVPGGSVSGEGCLRFWTGAQLLWQVKGETTGPHSYQIWTAGHGYDRCGSDPWTHQMTATNSDWSTDSGSSGNAQGAYLDCTSGHDYLVSSCHYSQLYSYLDMEGTCGSKQW
jgi:hypothetical protein